MKYKLLKDLPTRKAGAIYEFSIDFGSGLVNELRIDNHNYTYCSPDTDKQIIQYFIEDGEFNGDDWFSPIDPTCGKCGEGEETELCPKCGAESYGNCPCKPKEEKIEIKLPNLNIKLPREILDPDSGHTEEFRHWAVQMTTSVNKLNKGDN